ncbi:hypothetical protein niasHS_001887 [Heterodera schachtii]|uniref:Uncharacterized protein n=1 Tax=Heterodera schachtii TaxID=97005 RepID=A0ABD2KAR2_HETSC
MRLGTGYPMGPFELVDSLDLTQRNSSWMVGISGVPMTIDFSAQSGTGQLRPANCVQPTASQANWVPGQLGPRPTASQANCVPGQLRPRPTASQANCVPGQLRSK